ncbi:type VI secretion system tube protein Hcp [Vibrio tubiashii]|uniref:Hcp family type VI secretion system effector n=1 Tax=Vibrio TaxID=662 RepID=UPI0006595754|nr:MULTISPECIES: type VI secretion system tube protein Hcp [Vibrio]KLN65977.1 hypothetical protein ZX61_06230 [Vibrio sp. VPAP30]MCG9583603.1 type VI secretion system tube protein Hcp [Vibrio tubiashii]MCG9617180.1 type VI secretion system tube protein Hcp [Vibrio tubiashii]MCG9685864.1 type VI secretion system tube protein Hcp [Vibrio tubiashii]MCG9752091.1 type VI secretion system tube protein Hcp [Vibrio brasiliensis]
MASIYMRISGFNFEEGAATIEKIKTENGESTDWFAIQSYAWGGARNVAMDIGNATNADGGMVGVSEVSVTKVVDAASEALLSYLFAPGKDGRDVEIAFTKPADAGKGVEVYFQIKLEKARLVSYNVSGTDGSQPYESLSLSYTKISQKHHFESTGGDLKPGGIVTYDLPTGIMESGQTGS